MSFERGDRSRIEISSAEPDVSFVIPARDEESLIESALTSVLDLDAPNVKREVVVVDNGSSDQTSHVVKSFASLHREISIRVVREDAVGRSHAKNAGARVARGRLLIFLDADSRASKGLTATVVSRHASGWRAGAIAVAADSNNWLDRHYFGLMSLGPRLFGIRAQLFYCERALFHSLGGFDTRLQLAEDRNLLDRVRASGIGVCYINEAWILTSPRRLHRLPARLGM
ncbi:MAG TPA: glycosyltransferase, partial [Patescibacteria group bacterium]|nr:glycosyltransferase [Patescibacteria group bacterium]